MNSKTLIGAVAVVIVLGGAYYFWPEQSWPKDVIVSKTNDMKAGTSGTKPTGSANTQEGSESVKLARDPMMSGIWKSDTDPTFTREFRSDGVIVDRRVGGPVAGISGKWVPIDAFKEQALSSLQMQQRLSGKTVIKVVWDLDGKTTYFSVDILTATKLTTTDTASNGAMIAFTKI